MNEDSSFGRREKLWPRIHVENAEHQMRLKQNFAAVVAPV